MFIFEIIGLIIFLLIFLIWSDSYCEKQLSENNKNIVNDNHKKTIHNSDNNHSMHEIMRRMGMWD